MEQAVVITDSEYDIRDYLERGWMIVSVTPQQVSCGQTYSGIYGKFCFVMERKKS